MKRVTFDRGGVNMDGRLISDRFPRASGCSPAWVLASASSAATFTHCVVANVTTAVAGELWMQSWDDRFIDHERWLSAGKPDDFQWGVNWSMACPGPTYVVGSLFAAEWSTRVGHVMHEAIIETEAAFSSCSTTFVSNGRGMKSPCTIASL